MAFPVVAWALTSGPTQPEVQSFEPIGTTEMVDLFSGDFTYNIPLFEVPGPDGGYPVNLFYNSVTSGEAEASMVGLGWNIGIGAINRQMQGLPDDFNGEEITKTQDMKPNRTFGITRGIGFELLGADFKKLKLEITPTLQLSGSLMYNSYKGWGYSINPGLSLGMKKMGGGSMLFRTNFGFGLSSFDGASASLGFSLLGKKKEVQGVVNFGIGLNSHGANDLSFGVKGCEYISSGVAYLGSLIGRESPSFTPQISLPQTGMNISIGRSLGFDFWGAYVNQDLSGFYSEEILKGRNIPLPKAAYGFLYGQNVTDDGLLDLNREKEITILENSPNLPIPVTTPDLLSVVGHGIGGMYRPYRSDVGIYFDHIVESKSAGGSVSYDVDPTGAKTGLDLNGNFSISKTERLELSNPKDLGFEGRKANSDYEPYYYKSPGELTAESQNISDDIKGDEPVRLGVNKSAYNFYGLSDVQRDSRKPRSSSIQPITNKELLDNNNEEILPAYDVSYYDLGSGTTAPNTHYNNMSKTSLERDEHAPSQFAGYTTVTSNGAIWNFALPVKNKVQKDAIFSVPGQINNCEPIVPVPAADGAINHKVANNDHYLDITEIPEYTHAYMLTSVLGSDYVDVDPTDGEPNENDRGYWMVVDYLKVSDDYKWRAPFYGANYNKGYNSKVADDKGSFSYGEREVYLPATIRTKTHIAEFVYSQRNDGRGVNNWLQNAPQHGAYSYKLDEIKLYSIKEMEAASNAGQTPMPIKVVHFDYDYSLCKDVDNNATKQGKLTLKEVWFTYENSNRGQLSPYKFEYNGSNPDYDVFQFDSWGTNKPNPTLLNSNPTDDDKCLNVEEPYVDQTLSETEHAANISVWHISKIILPSGAEINLEIGRDHYGYVQDRVAAQMFKVSGTSVGTDGPNDSPLMMQDEDGYTANNYKLYFDLETPTTDVNDLKPYFENLYEDINGKQIYFRTRVKLLGKKYPGPDGLTYEDISGYAYLHSYELDTSPQNLTTDGKSKRGIIKLKPMTIEGENYHPIVLQARQFIKTNLPHLMYKYESDAPASVGDMVKEFFAIAGNARTVIGAFRDYYASCRQYDFGQELDLSRSYIRLNSPDKLKYGDGVRVKKVTMTDNWSEEDVPEYGMVYDYTADDDSSYGVATNEPSASKDESALRYMKRYKEILDRQIDNWLFFDYPINESYYPGASVGYSQVTVKSLATDASIKKANGDSYSSDYQGLDGFATSGVTIHKFYTAKDFPIITNETAIDRSVTPKAARLDAIPFVGQFTNEEYAGSQGYSIELNNMHGKPYEVINYPQDATGQIIEDAPISWVKYIYEDEIQSYSPNTKMTPWTRKRLKNIVDVLESDAPTADAATTSQAEVGVEREFFTDVRATSSKSYVGGIDFNMDVIGVGILGFPLPIPWPEMGESKTKVRTAVTNKIIRKTGILKKVIAYDGQAKVETENLVYDKLTGQPVLTRVNNNYDDPIYSYNIPAYLVYEGMGAAYENWGLKFSTSVSGLVGDLHEVLDSDINSDIKAKLIEGDEFIISESGTPIARATLVHKMSNLYFNINGNITSGGAQDFHLIRSGKRNHLSASAGNITALKNPTEGRDIDPSTNLPVSYTINTIDSSGNYGQQQKTMQTALVKDVLSASVVTYKNSWIEGDIDASSNSNPYDVGVSSQNIWRPDRSYAFVTDRKQTIDPTTGESNVDLKTDGTYTYQMFDWKKAQDMTTAYPKWRETNQITRYGTNGAELENKNILGQYSSALYGYNDNLATAVAVNARYTEIGFEGFEEYDVGAVPTTITPKGNIDWAYDNTGDASYGRTSETYNIEGIVAASSTSVVLNENFTNHSILLGSSIVLNLKDNQGSYYLADNTVNAISSTNDGKVKLQLANSINNNTIIANNEILSGDVKIYYAKQGSLPYINGFNSISIQAEGHTGKNALKVDSDAVFPQLQLHLKPNKEYVFSAWIKLKNTNNSDIKDKHTYKDNNNYFIINNTTTLHPAGPIIEGWQKIEGTFSISTSDDFNINVFVGSNYYMLIDDIRVFPKDGNIQTYVYDPINYRVTEVLDNNNFYTRYEYDEEGNLIILKKETIKGVKTLQESRSHIKSNQ